MALFTPKVSSTAKGAATCQKFGNTSHFRDVYTRVMRGREMRIFLARECQGKILRLATAQLSLLKIPTNCNISLPNEQVRCLTNRFVDWNTSFHSFPPLRLQIVCELLYTCQCACGSGQSYANLGQAYENLGQSRVNLGQKLLRTIFE